jgi:hypothetical protein
VPYHFVLFRPVNDPDLKNDILWVNHVDMASDAQFMQTMPGRSGYVLDWTQDCNVSLRPLASFGPGELAPGRRSRRR